MTVSYFFDTSAVIKLYHQETGTGWVEAIFGDPESLIIISELATLEVYSAVAKKIRTKEITEHAGRQAIANFQKDCTLRFLIAPLDSRVIRKAQELIRKHGNTVSIRTLDALQLTACQLEEDEGIHFVCADMDLIKVCELEAVSAINPETHKDR